MRWTARKRDLNSGYHLSLSQYFHNGGSHSLRRRGGLVALEKGLHRFRIEYFDDYSGETLEFWYLSADDAMQVIKAVQMLYIK